MSKTEEEYSWGVKDFKPEQLEEQRRKKQPGKGRGMKKIGQKKKKKMGLFI